MRERGKTHQNDFLKMSEVRAAKLKFSELKFLEENPRTITREDLERLAGRIKEDPTFFDNRPCLVNFADGQYVCYAGFQRAHAAAKVLKWKEVPCMIESDVPTDTMRKRAILDNTHDGDWDAHVLGNWEFEQDEYREMGVPDFVFGGIGGDEQFNSGDDVGYSGKNKEINVDDFSDLMELKFKFEKDAFMDVQERLSVVCARQNVDTKEEALIELLNFYERKA
jgi:hypothetical protein